MKLKRVRVTNYRSIEDSGWVDVGDVTCLVGKNESGKTAFLQALHRLHPTSGASGYDEVMDFPSKHYATYKRKRDEQPAKVVEAVFEVEDSELDAIEQAYGKGVLTSREITVHRGYDQTTYYITQSDEAKAVKHLTKGVVLPEATKTQITAAKTVTELRTLLEGVADPDASVTALAEKLASFRDGRFSLELIDRFFAKWLPRFFYFDEYSIMRGRVSLPHLQARADAETLEPAEETFIALLDLVHAQPGDFASEQNFERLTRELEAAANGISTEVFEYWTQNRDLEVSVQISQADPNDDPPLDEGPILNVRIRNQRHRVTVPFDERSRGFVWFFSFLAYFSQLEHEAGDLILLLDEPGLNLHATAQGDLLRFIDERLAPEHQVIYSTHSPFMVEAGRLERVRTVTDVEDQGTKISSVVFRTDSETIFPLQAALGYDLAQTLFVGPDNIVVEGPADFVYLTVLSEHLRSLDRASLDPRWVIVPVGGLDKIPTFVALLGAQLNAAVVMDSASGGSQKIDSLVKRGIIEKKKVIPLNSITATKEADIEDMFEEGFYLKLLKEAGIAGATKSKLGAGIRIVPRVEAALGHPFDHYRPARHLLEKQVELLPEVDEPTLARFEDLFGQLNALLS